MSSFFNNIDMLESSKSVFHSYNKISFPTYEQFLPFTELTVSLANEAIERDLGRIDMFTASDFLLKRELSTEAMLTALMYINRFKRRKETVTNKKLSSFTSADLFLISMMLASKYLFDDGTEENVVNEEWADDFGLENQEVNALEIDFLNTVDWRLHVESSDFQKLKQKICAYLAHQSWNSRPTNNGSTYCEVLLVHKNTDYNYEKSLDKFVEIIIKAVLGCVVVYLGVIIGVHIMVFMAHVSPASWNGILYRPQGDHISVGDKVSFNHTKLAVYTVINESRNYHTTNTHSFVIASYLSAGQSEQ